MNILAIHNKYLLSGGEDLCHAAEVALLRNNGHAVQEFIQDNQTIKDIGNTHTALRSIWSVESYNEANKIFKSGKFDLALVQNFFPLISPSVYFAANKYKVPIIQFLHNYRIACVNAMFFRNNKVCQDCLGKDFPLPGVIHKCYRDSVFGSLSVGTMVFTHRILKTWKERVDGYICLSENAKEIFIKAGLPKSKLFVRPNFIFPDPGSDKDKQNKFIFIGRLSSEKGVETLVNAAKIVNKEIKILVIGSGPFQNLIEDNGNNFKYIGQHPNSATLKYLKESQCLILPSIVLEGMPRTILEAFACGIPIIASNIGAMKEMIAQGKTGLLFQSGDSIDLAEKINWANDHPDEMKIMGENARKEFECKYTAEIAYQSLMDIYERIVNRK